MDNNKEKNGDLEKIKKINIDEIAKITHIDADIISDILNEKFENLLEYNVPGLVKIIEREFEVNLSEISQKFSDFKSQNKTNKKELKHVSMPSLSKKQKSNWKLWFLIAIIIVCVIVYFKIYNLFDNFKDNNVTKYSNEYIVENVENTLNNIGIDIQNIDKNETFFDINATDKNSTLNALELSILKEKNEANKTDKNITSDEIQTLQIQKVEILSNGKIWIGSIDLSTHKKSEITAKDSYEIDLTKDQLIITGHGDFKLKIGDEITNMNDKNKQRFLIKNGKIEKINEVEFKKLNNAKSW